MIYFKQWTVGKCGDQIIILSQNVNDVVMNLNNSLYKQNVHIKAVF